MDLSAALKLNAVVFASLAVVGVVFIVGGLLYASFGNGPGGDGCGAGNATISVASGYKGVVTVLPYKKNSFIVGLGDELLIIDVCKNKVLKRVRFIEDGQHYE